MERVLIVEDSATQASILKRRLSKELDMAFDVATTFSRGRELIESGLGYMAVLLDLDLPDAGPDETIDFCLQWGIPPVVFTADDHEEVMARMRTKPIIDCIVKGGANTVDIVADTLKRIHKNPKIKILLVADADTGLNEMTLWLERHLYQVLPATTTEEALSLLEDHPDTTLAIVHSAVQDAEGVELVRHIRVKHGQRDLAILGVLPDGVGVRASRFLKAGATDFLKMPFSVDEFHCRVTQNVQSIEHAREMREAETTDLLTGLHNRRFFFEVARNHVARAKRNREPLSVAMLDIDHFRRVNDVCGQEAGDQVLKHLARLLQSRFRDSDTVARLSGGEFCFSLPGMSATDCRPILDSICRAIVDTPVEVEGKAISVTVSMGVCTEVLASLDAMFKVANARLYAAKSAGRNRVVSE